ncbi:MAG: hypothetical protein LUE27_06905 [Clostridia bacterium]|nr:hypothetical protein [Clostridia bacterium]
MTSKELMNEKKHIQSIWVYALEDIERLKGKKGYNETMAVYNASRPYYEEVMSARDGETFYRYLADLEFYRAQIVVLCRCCYGYPGGLKDFMETYYGIERKSV